MPPNAPDSNAMSAKLLTQPTPPWQVRGSLRAQAPLAQNTWFQVGGPAQWLFKPKDEHDLAAFLAQLDAATPVTVIGVGSNLLVRDGGVPGVVIRLGRHFTMMEEVSFESGRAIIRSGAGALGRNLAHWCQQRGWDGLSFLSGIPGTVGGAVAMNAGAYGREVRDVLQSVTIVTRDGSSQRVLATDIPMAYRRCQLPEHSLVVAAEFAVTAGDKDDIAQQMKEIARSREESQPLRTRTGGSTFKNPPGHKAWQLIDEAGCRGLQKGGAQISEKHCNFMINTGTATAADLEALGEEVRQRVKAQSGIELQWEIRRIGSPVSEC